MRIFRLYFVTFFETPCIHIFFVPETKFQLSVMAVIFKVESSFQTFQKGGKSSPKICFVCFSSRFGCNLLMHILIDCYQIRGPLYLTLSPYVTKSSIVKAYWFQNILIINLWRKGEGMETDVYG